MHKVKVNQYRKQQSYEFISHKPTHYVYMLHCYMDNTNQDVEGAAKVLQGKQMQNKVITSHSMNNIDLSKFLIVITSALFR